MKDFLIKRYEAHQLENIRTIDSVAAEAKNEINNYWAIWKTRNKKIISTSDVLKQGSEKLCRYAPRLGYIGNAKKLTINWDDYASRLKRCTGYASRNSCKANESGNVFDKLLSKMGRVGKVLNC